MPTPVNNRSEEQGEGRRGRRQELPKRPSRQERRERRDFSEGMIQAEIARQGFEVIGLEISGDEIRARVGVKLRDGHPTGVKVHPIGRVRIPATFTDKSRDELSDMLPKFIAMQLGSAMQEPIMRDR